MLPSDVLLGVAVFIAATTFKEYPVAAALRQA